MVHLQAIRRILVAVDGSDQSLAALEAAATLAAQLEAELEALFVEDADLLRLADLPCGRVLSLLLLEAERTDRERMERQLRLQAARAQDAVRRRAAALGVRASFRAVRGEVVSEILAAAAGADLLTLGKAGRGRVRRVSSGSTLQAALAAGRPLLVAGDPSWAGQGLLAVYDGSAAGAKALALAGELASGSGQELNTVILARWAAEAEQLAARAREQLPGPGVSAGLSYSWGEPAAAILAAVRRTRPALLLLGLEAGDGDGQERAARILERVNCPLLLVP